AADTPRAPHRPAHCSGTTSGSTMALGGPAEVRVPTLALSLVSVAAALALVSLGGGLYEFLVVDPFWPRRPEIIQPARGGISRQRFWIPAHVAFELSLLAALAAAWTERSVRVPLLVG